MNKLTHKNTVLVMLSSLMFVQASAQAPTAPGSAAPAGASTKGVELKGKVPVNPQTLRVQLPKPQEARNLISTWDFMLKIDISWIA